MSDTEKKPWWNDGDKAGGLAATITLVGVAILLACVLAGLGVAFFMWIT